MSYRTYIVTSRAAYIAGIEAGISPQELRAHTGILGEAFVADYLGVTLSAANNQPGHDLVDADGLRVSVKTITTSNHVLLNENTIDQVDRVVVVWMDTKEDELDVVIVYDKDVETCLKDCAVSSGRKLRLVRGAMTFPYSSKLEGKFELGDVIETHKINDLVIRKHQSGSFTVLVGGEPQPARPHLIALRDEMGLPDKVNNTTRTLGAQIFGALKLRD